MYEYLKSTLILIAKYLFKRVLTISTAISKQIFRLPRDHVSRMLHLRKQPYLPTSKIQPRYHHLPAAWMTLEAKLNPGSSVCSSTLNKLWASASHLSYTRRWSMHVCLQGHLGAQCKHTVGTQCIIKKILEFWRKRPRIFVSDSVVLSGTQYVP